MTSIESNKEEKENFLASLGEFIPTIPDEVTKYYLEKTGFQCPDVRVQRLISIAAQKFVTEMIHQSLQHAKLRQSAQKGKKEKKLVFKMEDLIFALKEYGIVMKKPQYFPEKEENEREEKMIKFCNTSLHRYARASVGSIFTLP
ncbi:transcription initiation factor TFIID subunit 10 [Planoprotostelium fungivorum]|uniref:Transcription initiation factor TFIID subunit 10 n=1 Tax=Planoprotostelium fungivorum TaxID=1890364 RepID=A0A2P6MVS2_9EUKA|nr:transcription initiation factor TFIID subunit 10 [Planoprotostelium fungivorum]